MKFTEVVTTWCNQSLRMRCNQCVRRNLGVSRRKITSSRRTRTWTAKRWKRFVKIWKKANSRQPRTWVVQLVKKKNSTTRRPAWTPARMFKQRWCSITKALIQQHRPWSAWTFWNHWLCLSRLCRDFQNDMVVWLITMGMMQLWERMRKGPRRWRETTWFSCGAGWLEEVCRGGNLVWGKGQTYEPCFKKSYKQTQRQHKVCVREKCWLKDECNWSCTRCKNGKT